MALAIPVEMRGEIVGHNILPHYIAHRICDRLNDPVNSSLSVNYAAKIGGVLTALTSVVLGGGGSKVGFFVNAGAVQDAVTTLAANATTTTLRLRVNEVITALDAYNLV